MQPKNDADAISTLFQISCFGSEETVKTKEDMYKILEAISEHAKPLHNPKLAYWLGIAWRNFTAWYIRGEERKAYLNKTAQYFTKAFELSKETLPVELTQDEQHKVQHVSQIDIAGELGNLLVNEALIRDLGKAEKVLEFIYTSTKNYEPPLCAYAELFYKKGNYTKCAQIALDIHNRAERSEEWDLTPPAPMRIFGKAYRALGKQAKKDKRFNKAIKYFQKMKSLGVATENDLKILSKLKEK
jgi:tetratricopeptide (TPR) repeat protein